MADYLQKQFGLSGRRALVTGGSRGIGQAIAQALAAAGAEVCVHYNKSELAAGQVVHYIQAQGGDAWCARADLTNVAEVGGLFSSIQERWPALDILVNNAGDMCKRSLLEELDDETLEYILRVNLSGAMFVTRAATPLLRQGSNPVILNLSSISAHNGGAGGVSAYAAAKGGIHSLTRSLAKELAPQIRVNGIAPGLIMTDLHKTLSTEQQLRDGASRTPLQRIGTPEECAAAVVFLCGDGASYITGEIIEINGGLWFA